MQTKENKREFGFDIARAISMFYIVGVLHLSGYFPELSVTQNKSLVSLIWSTLGVFTFLSSFLLASRYTFSSLHDVKQFYKKRVLRFYPLFFISSLMLLAIGFNNWPETWKGLLGISPFWKPQQHTLWYISMLIGFYILTPLLCVKRISVLKRVALMSVFVLIALGIQIAFHSVDPRFFYYYIVYCLGIVGAIHYKNICSAVFKSKKTLITLLIYIPLFFLLFLGYGDRLLMMGAGYIGIIVLLNVSMLLSRIRANTFQRIVSIVSYSSMCMYLFHREVYWMLLKLYNPVTNWGGASYLFIIGLPLVFVISYCIQKLYDKLTARF